MFIILCYVNIYIIKVTVKEKGQYTINCKCNSLSDIFFLLQTGCPINQTKLFTFFNFVFI